MQLHANHVALARVANVSYAAPSTNPTLGMLPVPQTHFRRHQQHVCSTSATNSGAFVPVEWESDAEVHDEESLQRKALLITRFKAADTDGCVCRW